MKMRKGKELCELLKSIRQKLADANGIEYETHECYHEGDCRGTCPMCDGELEKLTNEISNMIDDGVEVNFDVLTDEEKEFLNMRWGACEDLDGPMLEGLETDDDILLGDIPAPKEDDGLSVTMGMPQLLDIVPSNDDVPIYEEHIVEGVLLNEDGEPVPLRIIKEYDHTAGVSKKNGQFRLKLNNMPTTVCLAACDGYQALEVDVKTEDYLKIVLLRE